MDKFNFNSSGSKNSWEINAVETLSGKSFISNMSPEAFNDFLWVLMRYDNQSYFLNLATNLKPSQSAIADFMHHWKNDRPSGAAKVLDYHLLINRPEGWDYTKFADYLGKKKLKQRKTGKSNPKSEVYGIAETALYIKHVESEYYQYLLTGENVTCNTYSGMLRDWYEVVSITGGAKNRYLRNNVLYKLLNVGLTLQDDLISEFNALGVSYDANGKNAVADSIYRFLDHDFYPTVCDIFKDTLHDLNSDQCMAILEKLFTSEIAFRRNDEKFCRKIGMAFWDLAYGIPMGLYSGANVRTTKNFYDLGRYWAEQKRKEANNQYGPLPS